MITYEANGQRYEEMHVDGGVTRQVFLFPAALNWYELIRKFGFTGRQHLYVLRNSNLTRTRRVVDHRLRDITLRSISILTANQGIGDLHRLYLIASRNDIDYNLAYIPADFREEPQEFPRGSGQV